MNKVILVILILALATVVYSAPTKHQHNGRTHTHQYPVSGANHKHGGAKPKTANIKPKNVANNTVPSIPLKDLKRMIRLTAIDPSSIKFGPFWIGQGLTKGEPQWCGYVNGKNAYGGYTGMMLYATGTNVNRNASIWLNGACKEVK